MQIDTLSKGSPKPIIGTLAVLNLTSKLHSCMSFFRYTRYTQAVAQLITDMCRY